jgi:hypothetical protein
MKVVVLSLSDDGSETDAEAPSGLSREREEAAYRRRVELLWKGKTLHVDGGEEGRRSSKSASSMLSRGDIQQLFGPTYPARRYTSTDGLHDYLPLSANKTTASSSSSSSSSNLRPPLQKERWILSYDGFSFLFEAEGQDRNELSKNARPVALVLHVGEDPLNPGEVPWPRLQNHAGFNRGNETRAISLEGQITDTAQCDGLWKDANVASAGMILEQAIIRVSQTSDWGWVQLIIVADIRIYLPSSLIEDSSSISYAQQTTLPLLAARLDRSSRSGSTRHRSRMSSSIWALQRGNGSKARKGRLTASAWRKAWMKSILASPVSATLRGS